jgi:hypothetical protein
MSDKPSVVPPEILALLGLADGERRGREFFTEVVRFAERANMTDSQVYNAIGLNRSLWYRMRDDSAARTKKPNVLKLAVVLRLTYWEAYYIIALAGYSFTPGTDETDNVIMSCLINGVYDIETVDKMLYDAGADTLFAEL